MFPKKSLKVLLSIFTITLLVGLGFRVALALNYIDFSGTDTQDIRWPAGQTLSFVQGGAERMRIDATTGNVVIPQGLTVSGTFNMTGTYTGSVSAGNISSGDFGSNYSGGNFSFPANVGIGTTSPGWLLDVNGNAMVRGALYLSIGQAVTASTQTGADLSIYASGATGAIQLGTNGDRNRLVVASTGNVGIGTTGPGTLLHINKPADSDFFTISQGASYKHSLYNYFSGTDSRLDFKIASGAGTQVNTMTLKGDGNVGIGTTSPGYGLDVVSDSYVRIGTKTNIGNSLYLNKYSSATSNNLVFQTAGTINARIRMGDGVTNRLDIDDGTTGNERLSIRLDTGNVGIGTTSQTEKLHVQGNARITGNLQVDGTFNLAQA